MTEVADLFVVGDSVMVDSLEGFGGPARVVEVRESEFTKCKVRMDDGSQPDFWAHDFELSVLPRPDGPYDSRPDTIAHIATVRRFLAVFVKALNERALAHDLSKLAEPEKATFDEFTPKLKGSTYGSEEYKSFLTAMKPALEHHYANNSHHPEHFTDGIRGMGLLDILEMLADWKAATERHADGDLAKSIELNQKRFGYSDELKAILSNTARAMRWI